MRKNYGFSDLTFWFVLLVCILHGNVAFAQSPDAATMLDNLTSSVPNFMRLTTAFAYVAGMFFIYKGIIELKQFGESRTMMSTQHSMIKPLLFLFSGTCLLYLPTTVLVGTSTFWTDAPYAYLTDDSNPFSSLVQDVYLIIGLAGTISFVRGVMMLTQLAGQAQQGIFARSMTHMIAGIFCINLYQFIDVLNNTLGITQLTS